MGLLKLFGLEKIKTASFATSAESLSTTLNPLFSEEDIYIQNKMYDKWQHQVELYFDQRQKTEKEEIKKHQLSGKNKSEFVPSSKLINIILRLEVAITGRNTSEETANRMIEANISIRNGNLIKDVSKKFDSERDGIPWHNINLDADAWRRHPKIQKEFELAFQDLFDCWQKNWKSYLDEE
jgi:hypothetical protein